MAAPWNNSSAETKTFRALFCDTLWRIANRTGVADSTGKVTQAGLKAAAQAQYNTYHTGTLPQ